MPNRPLFITVDGNEAVARVAHKINEVIAIYPITPASPMGEWADIYSAKEQKNIWGDVPDVYEMQSEGGAAGAVHGALQAGSLTTTFTASQGLLLMLPNMYKIAGELTPTVFHVAARSIASQALSIFGDHTDVMAVRQSGFALLASASVQEAQDFALISQVASLRSRVPFVHFFDGFRTSHEVKKITPIDDATLHAMLDDDLLTAHRKNALTPDHPFIRGTAQNPDVFFQGRESVNRFIDALPEIMLQTMNEFATHTQREYAPFVYVGSPTATKIIIIMGSGAQTVQETVEFLNKQGEDAGAVLVKLYRPFSSDYFLNALPNTTQSIAVLDRTKEPGSMGEPLYLDVVASIGENMQGSKPRFTTHPTIVGGRYGLSSKEFTPAMVKSVFENLSLKEPKNHFTIGIFDDVTHTSLEWDPSFHIPSPETFKGIFYGLGSDGTVGANKNSIKIIGENTPFDAQGYFVYDSKKSGSMTVSHLRFGPKAINAPYLIDDANFVACHQTVFIEKFDILARASQKATFLLNTPFEASEVFDRLPLAIQEEIIKKELTLYAINAYAIAKEVSLHRRINTIMQTAFFHISEILPHDQAIEYIKAFIDHSYAKKGSESVVANLKAVDATLEALFKVTVPKAPTSRLRLQPSLHDETPSSHKDTFLHNVTARLIAGEGDMLPVSAIPEDGTWPTGTTRYEKRNIALEIPVWDSALCIQCNSCVTVCPHAVIRANVYDQAHLENAPKGFDALKAKGKQYTDDERFTIQVSPEDCTGCSLCVEACPASDKTHAEHKAINMTPIEGILEAQKDQWHFFDSLDPIDRARLDHTKMKEAQLLQPLFEFSGACPGCGETPYIKLATQLFGDRMLIANATGCSSIYGGNLPTTPWSKNAQGKGPAWSNSLFEDNAEFGLGFRLSVDHTTHIATSQLQALPDLDVTLVNELLNAPQITDADISAQRERVERLKRALTTLKTPQANDLLNIADYLVKKSIWLIGGDGWAYDIDYGGLDHVLSSGKNVNILVLDTQVYSNTGGQQSKATPTGAIAKFAAGGKASVAKDLAQMALAYEDVYVARIALGKSENQTLKAFIEAERYEGVSIIIAYSHCIAHGYDMRFGMQQQEKAVDSGLWPLFRYDPTLIDKGLNPMRLDYKAPRLDAKEYMRLETRFSAMHDQDPQKEQAFIDAANAHAQHQWHTYESLVERFEPQTNPK